MGSRHGVDVPLALPACRRSGRRLRISVGRRLRDGDAVLIGAGTPPWYKKQRLSRRRLVRNRVVPLASIGGGSKGE